MEQHIPVLSDQVGEIFQNYLDELFSQNDGKKSGEYPVRYLDCTFGRGGHLKKLLKLYPKLFVLAMDQDCEAITHGRELFHEIIASHQMDILHENFQNFTMEKYSDRGLFDFILVDLGVSSPQLDQSQRGFSFYADGPLDMRMDVRQTRTAADILAKSTSTELTRLFQTYGEVRNPHRVVQAIINGRKLQPWTRTTQLSRMIEREMGWVKKGIHPATQYFLALRLEVNQELQAVEQGLPLLMNRLKPKGRLAVLTFHSLEDRIVKYLFKESLDLGRPLYKKVIQATWEEKKSNPRARSAKLRVFERCEEREHRHDVQVQYSKNRFDSP